MADTIIPAHIMSLDDLGDVQASKGSASWARAIRYELYRLARQSTASVRDFQTYLKLLEEYKGYQQLEDEAGQPFASISAFAVAKIPFGLGYDPDIILHLQEETREMLLHDKMQELLLGHGGDRRSKEFQDYNYNFEKALQGTSARYILNRLKRKRPDLAEAFARGEYRSVHAAAKAAGWVKASTPLDELLRAWHKASDEERIQFFHQIPDSQRDLLVKALARIERPMQAYEDGATIQ